MMTPTQTGSQDFTPTSLQDLNGQDGQHPTQQQQQQEPPTASNVVVVVQNIEAEPRAALGGAECAEGATAASSMWQGSKWKCYATFSYKHLST